MLNTNVPEKEMHTDNYYHAEKTWQGTLGFQMLWFMYDRTNKLDMILIIK
jgi:hypothetical protein